MTHGKHVHVKECKDISKASTLFTNGCVKPVFKDKPTNKAIKSGNEATYSEGSADLNSSHKGKDLRQALKINVGSARV